MMKASGSGVGGPKDLAAQLKYWIRPRYNRLWVLNFLDFAGPDAHGRYEEHGIKVHLFSKATYMSKVERWPELRVEDAEKADAFALLSFLGERKYAGSCCRKSICGLIRG